MKNLIVVLILLGIISGAIIKIIIEKRKGSKCIGCPSGSSCNTNCNCNIHK